MFHRETAVKGNTYRCNIFYSYIFYIKNFKQQYGIKSFCTYFMAGMYISALMNTGQNTREQSNITGIQALSILLFLTTLIRIKQKTVINIMQINIPHNSFPGAAAFPEIKIVSTSQIPNNTVGIIIYIKRTIVRIFPVIV